MLENKNARLVIVKNPFQPWNGRIIKEIAPHTKLRNELVGNANIGCDIYTSVDGKTVLIDDYEVLGGEVITVSPVVGKGGKSILGLVAMVALAVVSHGIAISNVAIGGALGVGASAATAIAYGLAAVTMFVGGTLINKAFYSAPKTPSLTNTENEATYGWSGVQTLEGQNNAMQMTYGKVKSAGQSIAKYVQVKDNKEYLNWLIACGEGELTFSDIMINDNPYTYYDGMQLETRAGTNNQTVIPYFNDTYFTKSLGYEVKDNEYRRDTAQGNGTQGLIVKIEFSQGLYYAKDDGNLGEAWVKVKAEYKLVTSSTWTKLFEEQIKGSQSSALRKEFRVDNITAGEYEVRVTVTGRSHKTTDSRAGVKCYWSAITSIVYDDFAYPNTALIGVRALATDQINGSPTISFLKERKYVWVYCPPVPGGTQETEVWHYEQRPANNPAWASYDMLHLCSRLYNINTKKYEYEVRGVPANSLIYEQFNEWAKFCESKKYYVNIEIGSTEEMLNCINDNIACIGHGLITRYGTKYGAVWYCAKQPVQMFGMGNIISGTFKEDFLETTSRANAVEITYFDAEHDYNKETITIYSDNYDSDAVENATQVTFNGITSYEQAFREGKYQLYCNKYQLRTVSFEANIDAIACTIGDVVLVAHDVPQWTHSGRIYEVDTTNGTFRLPVELTTTSGNIRLMYRTENDNLYTTNVGVIENGDGWCTVQGNIPNIDDLPKKGDIFDIGLTEIGSKPFIITSITRAQDFTRSISGIEYIETIYNEQYDIPPINYSEAISGVAENVTGLNGNRVQYVTSDGRRTTRLFASWNATTNGGRYTLLYSGDNKNTWNVLQSGMTNCEWQGDVSAFDEIYIKVITVLGVSKSSGVVYGPITSGVDELPPDVKSLDVEVLGDRTRRYFWDFEYPIPNDIAGFKMRYVQGTSASWDAGYDVQDGLILSQPYETTTVRQGDHVIMIKAVDNAGNESENPAVCVVNFGDPLEDNVLFKKDFSANGWEDCETDGNVLPNGYVYSKQTVRYWNTKTSAHWDSQNALYWEESYTNFHLDAYFVALAGGYFYLLYDIEGACNLTYRNRTTDELFKPYSTKVLVSAGDVIDIHFETPMGATRTILKSLVAVIDVPDRVEHFKNIRITTDGTRLPIITPNYRTTAVRFDSLNYTGETYLNVERVSNEPCVVKVYAMQVENGKLVKTYINCNADITWQGFEQENIATGYFNTDIFNGCAFG